MHVDRARSRRRDTRQVEKLIASGCVEPQRARQRVYPASKAALNMVTAMYAKALPQVRVVAVDPRLHRDRAQRVHRTPVGR